MVSPYSTLVSEFSLVVHVIAAPLVVMLVAETADMMGGIVSVGVGATFATVTVTFAVVV